MVKTETLNMKCLHIIIVTLLLNTATLLDALTGAAQASSEWDLCGHSPWHFLKESRCFLP